MSDHLPECFCTDTPLKPKRVRGLCICDRLRQAEQRGYGMGWDDGVAAMA